MKRFIAFALLGIGSLTISGCLGNSSEPSSTPSTLKQQELEQAIFFLEGNLGTLGDVGYAQWTPTTAAEELVTTMNASQVLLPEEEDEYRQAGIKPKEVIPYVLNQPTEAWQVVLVPDDTQQTIYVQGFGNDLETPLIEKDLPCCGY
jgi:hypothetical protein